MRRDLWTVVCLLLWATLLPASPASAGAAGLRLEGVAVIMRHGVRPPTKAEPMAAGLAADPWPAWPVAPGWLTPHGAEAVRLSAEQDRRLYASRGLLPAGPCPAAGSVAIWADVDQRTVATGEAWSRGFAPGCRLAVGRAAGDSDPLFSPFDFAPAPLSAEAGAAAVQARLPSGGLAALAAAHRDLAERLSRVLGCCAPPACATFRAAAPCGLADLPTALVAAPGKRPKLEGALDLASTAAQILLLEYADGKPLAEVGWGRASAADIAAFSAFHALEFDVLARPPALAAANGGPIARRLAAGLEDMGRPGAPRLLMLMGHDTNVANIAGLLDLHWRIPGFARDDPAPGGQLGFERLRDRRGRVYVRAFYQAATLEQIRTLSADPPVRQDLTIPGCSSGPGGTCPLAAFRRRLVRAPS